MIAIVTRSYATLRDGRRVRVAYWEPLPGELTPSGRQVWGPVVRLPEHPVPQGLSDVDVEDVPTAFGRLLGVKRTVWRSP